VGISQYAYFKKKQQKQPQLDLALINNLARKKFGSPDVQLEQQQRRSMSSSPKKSNISRAASLKCSEIIPKSNQINENRAILAKSKRYHHNEKEDNTDKTDHVNSTLIDGLSFGLDYFANNNDHNDSARLKSEKILTAEEHDDFDAMSCFSPKLISEIGLKSSLKSMQGRKASQTNRRNAADMSRHVKILEIDPEELYEIEQNRNNLDDFKSGFLPTGHRHLNPVEIVAQISNKVVLNVVNSVCHEAIEQDLVAKLLHSELKF
jgi:hypothetical protein